MRSALEPPAQACASAIYRQTQSQADVVYYNMITVSEAARRTGRNPETIRRWIHEGKLPARKIGTQYFIDEEDLPGFGGGEYLPLPPELTRTMSGEPMPDVLAILRRQRASH